MLSVFDRVFKRSNRTLGENQLTEPSQSSLVGTSQDDSKPNSEITAIELVSPQLKDLSRDIVFIDGAVENISHLLRDLDPGADLYVLHLQSDGLEQISDYLLGRKNLSAVHLFCNGGQDFLNLGSAQLTKGTLSRVQTASLMRISNALAEHSDFLIYGCEFGTNVEGAELVRNLSEIIGADIAVSPQVAGGDQQEIESVKAEVLTASSVSVNETTDPAIVGKTNGSNGTVVFDLTGNITYVADPGFHGKDSFEFRVAAGDTIERVKMHVNIVPEETAVGAESVSHFNILSEGLLTSLTSNHGLSLAEGKLSLGKNGKFEFVRAASCSEPSTVFINLQSFGGEGTPSFKIAVASSNCVPSIVTAEPLNVVAHQKTLPLEANNMAGEAAPDPMEQVVEPEASEREIIVEIASETEIDTLIQFEDFSGGTLNFSFDQQLQEPQLTGNSILGQLIVDSYVRPGTLFLDVNNSFDPRVQGVVSHYLVKQADGSPLPEYVQIIRDGFFTIDQNKGGDVLDLSIEVALLDGHIASRPLRVNIETGSLEALEINRTAGKSNIVRQAPVSAKDSSALRPHTSITH